MTKDEAIKKVFDELMSLTKEEFDARIAEHLDDPRTLSLIECWKEHE